MEDPGMFPQFALQLPAWVEEFIGDPHKTYETIEERMALTIALSRLNVEKGTGGPFAAGVFDLTLKKLLAPGVNLVLHHNCSVLHAEMVALILAQKIIGHHDLGAGEGQAYELVTTTEPCAMCLGAVPWSGVARLVCGARDEDARSVGFEEGAKIENWVESLEERNITVVRDIQRQEAKAVLRLYAEGGGIIYNSEGQNAFRKRFSI